MKITILGPPIPKARPKFSMRGKYAKAYDPQSELKKIVLLQVKNQIPFKFEPHEALVMNLYLHIKTSISCAPRKNKRISWGIEPHLCKPDVDNLGKFYLDLLNGLAYEDDRQIVELHVHKFYSDEDKTVIEIMAKKTHSDLCDEFLELISLDEFLEFADDLFSLSSAIKCKIDIANTSDNPIPEHCEKVVMSLKEFATNYGKIILDFQKKIKNLEYKNGRATT